MGSPDPDPNPNPVASPDPDPLGLGQCSMSQLCGYRCCSQVVPLEQGLGIGTGTDASTHVHTLGTILAVATNTALCTLFANIPAAVLAYSVDKHVTEVDRDNGRDRGRGRVRDNIGEVGRDREGLQYALMVYEILETLYRSTTSSSTSNSTGEGGRELYNVLLQVHIGNNDTDTDTDGSALNTYDDIFTGSPSTTTDTSTGVLDVKLLKILQ